jgi:hypothetical protein
MELKLLKETGVELEYVGKIHPPPPPVLLGLTQFLVLGRWYKCNQHNSVLGHINHAGTGSVLLRSVLIISVHLGVGFPSGSFPDRSHSKTHYTILLSPLELQVQTQYLC